MHLFLSLAILASGPVETNQGRHPDAVEVFHCDFGPATDKNFDRWPDGWTRRRGPRFPTYLEVALTDEPSPTGNGCLRIDLDGGAAAVYSPPIEVSSLFSYVLEGQLKTLDLTHDVAYYSVRFYDIDRKPVETHLSEKLRTGGQWRKLTVGPFTPTHDDVHYAVVGLHLSPTQHADLNGAALFDDVWLARLPRMTLRTNSTHNVYSDAAGVEITCDVSGILERDPLMTFELIDVASRELARRQHRLDGRVVARKQARAAEVSEEEEPGLPSFQTHGFYGKAVWRPPIQEPGFYRVRVTMAGSTGVMHQRSVTLAIVSDEANPRDGEFGWSLPRGQDPLPYPVLAGLLGQVGINWVKVPVWYSEKDPSEADRISLLVERLATRYIRTVGVLDEPPAESRSFFGEDDDLVAASVFADARMWQPVLDPVMTRLALKIRWWQLGADGDTSFVGYPQLAPKIYHIKKHLERFGQEIRLGIGWNWMHELPQVALPPWDFLSLSADPPLTADELENVLATSPSVAAQRWIVLEPLPRSQYSVDERARDLVQRMLAAKIHRAECVCVPDPFSTEHGLMNDDGSPGELLLPWRTTSLLLSGTEYLGSIQMPEGSENHIFARGREAVMVVWNQRPVNEVVYLGENVKLIDLWGRMDNAKQTENGQELSVGPLPIFITGVHPGIARLRQSFQFSTQELASVFGRQQEGGYTFTNYFDQGIGGELRLVFPAEWDVDPKSTRVRLSAGETLEEEFRVMLGPLASSGIQPVRIDLDIVADRNYRFSIYRTINVGLEDVTMEVTTYMNERGDLVVEQQMENRTDAFVNFNCYLYPPGRRRMRQQVTNLGRGRDTKIYILPNGKEFAGQSLQLRAEEIGGDRTLNYNVPVE